MILDHCFVGQRSGVLLHRKEFLQRAADCITDSLCFWQLDDISLCRTQYRCRRNPCYSRYTVLCEVFLLQNGVNVLFCFRLCYRAAYALFLEIFIKGVQMLGPQVGELNVSDCRIDPSEQVGIAFDGSLLFPVRSFRRIT